MTLTYTTPTEPEFHTITVPTPITVTLPDLPESDIDFTTFSGADAKLLAWAYTQYGEVFQATIDEKTIDLLDPVINTEIYGILKEQIMVAADNECKTILEGTAAKGFTYLPGYAKRAIYDITIAARRELSQKSWEQFLSDLKLSDENIDFAVRSGAKQQAVLFDNHHNIQMMNLDAAVSVAKVGHQQLELNVRAYDAQIRELSQGIKNHDSQRTARMLDLESAIAQFDAVIVQEEDLDSAIYQAAISLVDMQNNVELADLRLIEIEAKTARTEIELYHTQLREYSAGIEVIYNTYQDNRLSVDEKIAVKNEYLKNLEVTRAEIRNSGAQLDADAATAKREVVEQQKLIQGYRTDVKELQAILDQKRLEAEEKRLEHSIDLLGRVETIRQNTSDALNTYDVALNNYVADNDANIVNSIEHTNYNIGKYEIASSVEKGGVVKQWNAVTNLQRAVFEAAAATIFTLEQNIQDDT